MKSGRLIGRYLPTQSIIHHLDARGKLLSGFYFIAILFLANNWQSYVLLSIFTLITVSVTKVPLGIFMKGIRPLIRLILFTVVLQIFFVRAGTVLFELGPFTLTEVGLTQGVFIFFRFFLMVVMTTVVTLTTSPLELMEAVEYVLKPLRVFKVPVQDIAFMLSVSLRFVPTLMDEATRIMNAQRARGVEFGEGNLFEQMKSVVPVFLPLFISSFYRAEDMANVMDARGYRGGRGRTKLKLQKWQGRDMLFLVAYGVVTALLVYLRN